MIQDLAIIHANKGGLVKIEEGDVVFVFHGLQGQFMALEMLKTSSKHYPVKFRCLQFNSAFEQLTELLVKEELTN